MSQKSILPAIICFVVAASWSCISAEAVAQRTFQNADAFATDLPSQGEQAPSVAVPQQLRMPGELGMPGELPLSQNAPSLNGQLTRPQLDNSSSQFANNRQSMPTPQSGFNVRLAQAPKMLGDFFGRRGNQIRVFEPLGISAVADGGPGNFAPGGPFGVVSIVDGLDINGNGVPDIYLYRLGPPVPFGEFTITEQLELNGDGVDDFELDIDTTNADIVGLDDPNADYAAISNDVVTPSQHDLYDLFVSNEIAIPFSGPGDLTGRARIQDNNSAIPQDRIYFDYSFFHNAKLTADGIDVSRLAPGFEKTFLQGLASVEIRVPMAVTLNSDMISSLPADTSNFELGNALINTKFLLLTGQDWGFAAGLGVAIPTGDDIRVNTLGGSTLLKVENDSVHLLPYMGWAYAPKHRSSFAHAFITFDFDTNGSTTLGDNGTGLERLGTWNDQNLVTLNLAYGSWLYENRCPRRCNHLQSLAWSAELHYTATMNDSDTLSSGRFELGDPTANLSLLNATVGLHAEVGKTTYTAGYATPITSSDRVFDGELRLFVNRAF